MATPDLAVIEKVELREVWPNEAADFTPWLQQHLSALGDALDMQLEIQEREAPVGGFSLDLLARDLSRNRVVIIENQLTKTNHNHLGQLLTYAAGYDASVVIWLAEEIRDEHRQALDWLNQRTDANTEFFGVVVELLTIDESRPAVNFKLLAFPNEWRKANVSSPVEGGVSEKQEAYRGFFQALIDQLREEHNFTRARKGQAQSFYSFSSGFAGVRWGSSFARGGRVRVELYIDRNKEWNKWLFDKLFESKGSLESAIGEALVWERLDERNACRISAVRTGTIEDDSETLEEIKEWSVVRLLRFRDVFGPELQTLQN